MPINSNLSSSLFFLPSISNHLSVEERDNLLFMAYRKFLEKTYSIASYWKTGKVFINLIYSSPHLYLD